MQKLKLILTAAIRGALAPTIIVGWLAASVVVAISGPFGTFETHSLIWRLGYWSLVIGVAIPIGILCRTLWEHLLDTTSLWIKDFFVIATLALIFGPLLVGFNLWLVGQGPDRAVSWPVASFVTFCVGLALVTMRRRIHDSYDGEGEATPARDRLLDRIDAPKGRRLCHVCSDNHYIRILTDDGTEHRILMRLRDAIAEIDVEVGLSTHRSHWVARACIDRIEEVAGKEVVLLTCGRHVPIGPTYRPHLISEGVLAA